MNTIIKIHIICALLLIAFAGAAFAAEFYASPNGSPSGDGSIDNPWDLQTAIKQPASVKPGDTIWLRGGTYAGRFTSTLTGTAESPIKVRAYEGEDVKIDGNKPMLPTVLTKDLLDIPNYTNDTFTVSDASGILAGYLIKIESEEVNVTAVNGNTITGVRGWDGTEVVAHASGTAVDIRLPQSLFSMSGAYTWYQDLEFLNSATTTRYTPETGSHPWTMNRGNVDVYGPGVKIINCVIHDVQQGWGSWSNAPDSEIYGSIAYNNGWMSDDRGGEGHGHGIYTQNQTGTKLIKDSVFLHNFGCTTHMYGSSNAFLNNYSWVGNIMFSGRLLFGGGSPINNLRFEENMTYNNELELGYANQNNEDTYFDNNYIMGGLNIKWFKNISVYDNYLFGVPTFQGSPYGRPVSITLPAGGAVTNYKFDRNIYYQTKTNQYEWAVSGTQYTFSGWQALGQDPNSSYILSPSLKPSGTKVFVRPNEYDTNRANIVIYNWDDLDSVDVDISNVLSAGDKYELRGVLDYYGDVLTGTVNGSTITVPMTNHTVAKPFGYDQTLGPNTFPQFGAFVLIKKSASAGIPGDVNGDGVVNVLDLIIIAKAFGSKTADPNWNENADLDKNGTVNIADLIMAARNFGRTS